MVVMVVVTKNEKCFVRVLISIVMCVFSPTRALLESGKETVKVLVAIRDKQDVQRVARALNWSRSVVSTESAYDA